MKLTEKLRLGGMAFFHAVADKVIDLNDIGAVKQQIRDLQDGASKVKNDIAVLKGHLVTTGQYRDRYRGEADGLQRAIDTVLLDKNADNDVDAILWQKSKTDLEAEIAAAEEEIVSGTEDVNELQQALNIATSKIQSLNSQVRRLESLSRLSESKGRAAKTLEGAAAMLGEGSDLDIDDITRKIRDKANVNDVKLDQAMDGVHATTEADPSFALAKDAIEKRRQELAAARGTETQAPA